MAICNEGEHSWHLISDKYQQEMSEKEHYTVNIEPGKDQVMVKERVDRYVTFICDKCGLLKKIPIQVEIK